MLSEQEDVEIGKRKQNGSTLEFVGGRHNWIKSGGPLRIYNLHSEYSSSDQTQKLLVTSKVHPPPEMII